MKISPARTATFDILSRIETESAFSSILLPEYEAKLSPRDRGLCHEIVLGVLRRKLFLDRMIALHSKAGKLDVPVRIALQIGIYQLLFLDRIPPHSAINESVNLVQRAKKTSAKGLVNAVLRRIAAEAPKLSFTTESERISVETSHPEWLIAKWADDWGPDRAEKIVAANNKPSDIAFRFTLKGIKAFGGRQRSDELAERSGWKRSENAAGCWTNENGLNDELRQLAADSLIYFQDEASQMVAEVALKFAGGRIFDACAAPGSKTTAIAAGLWPEVRHIVAGDLHFQRVKFLRENCRRQEVGRVDFVQYDATGTVVFEDGSFNVVLVDAPCTGTGTIRHNPEIRYSLAETDPETLSRKQLAILRNASNLVERGGMLVYSTCSLEPEENEAVIGAFLAEATGFRTVTPPVSEDFITPDRFVRTFPDRDGMDGFFIAVLTKE